MIEASRDVTIAPHSGLSIGSFDLFDRFFDAGHCYRFGPAPHDTVHASFIAETADQRQEAFHFLSPPTSVLDHVIDVALGKDAAGFFLDLQAPVATRFIEITDDTFQPDDNYFNLAPGHRRIVRLTPPQHSSGDLHPSGRVAALTLKGSSKY